MIEPQYWPQAFKYEHFGGLLPFTPRLSLSVSVSVLFVGDLALFDQMDSVYFGNCSFHLESLVHNIRRSVLKCFKHSLVDQM